MFGERQNWGQVRIQIIASSAGNCLDAFVDPDGETGTHNTIQAAIDAFAIGEVGLNRPAFIGVKVRDNTGDHYAEALSFLSTRRYVLQACMNGTIEAWASESTSTGGATRYPGVSVRSPAAGTGTITSTGAGTGQLELRGFQILAPTGATVAYTVAVSRMGVRLINCYVSSAATGAVQAGTSSTWEIDHCTLGNDTAKIAYIATLGSSAAIFWSQLEGKLDFSSQASGKCAFSWIAANNATEAVLLNNQNDGATQRIENCWIRQSGAGSAVRIVGGVSNDQYGSMVLGCFIAGAGSLGGGVPTSATGVLVGATCESAVIVGNSFVNFVTGIDGGGAPMVRAIGNVFINVTTACAGFGGAGSYSDCSLSAAVSGALVTIGNDPNLTGERALTGSGTVLITDNGANSTVVISVIQSGIDHGSIGGLLDDDHTQYALLAGRSGGQALYGGTDAGNDLTLKSTSHGTKGSIFIDELDGLLVNGYAKIGALSAPLNTTAGDLTATRIMVGDDEAFSSARIFQVRVPPTAPALGGFVGASVNLVALDAAATGDFVGLLVSADVQPTAASASRNTAMKMDIAHSSGAFDLTSATALIGIQANVKQEVAASTVNVMTALSGYALVSAGNATSVRITSSTFDGTGGGAVATVTYYHIQVDALPTSITNHRGINIPNLGGAGVVNAVGVEIAAQSGASTANFGIRNTGNSVQTGYARIGSVTAPVNVTDGDLTVTRLLVSSNTALSATAGYFFRAQGTMTDTANGATVGYFFGPTIAPASNSLSDFRVLFLQSIIAPSAGVTLDTIQTIRYENRYRTDAAVASLTSLWVNAVLIDSSAPTAWGTLTIARGIEVETLQSLSATDLGTVTTAVGIDVTGLTAGGVSFTVGTMIGLRVADLASGATITTQIGIDIAKPTRGSTNIGLRVAGTAVYTPTEQILAAAGNAIAADATVKELSNSTGAGLTLTSTPTIANGQDGQILVLVNKDSADNITLQDEAVSAGSNLRLAGGVNITLGPRDTLTLYFSSALGDWVELARSNN